MSLPSGRVSNDPSNYLAIGLQTGKDVEATTFYYLRHLDGSGFDVDVQVEDDRVGGSGREIALRYRTKVTSDGQYVAYAQSDFCGRVLYAALGSPDIVTAGPSNSALQLYNHKLNSGSSQLPYQTVEQAWADSIDRATNCMVSDVKLEGEAGKPVKLTAQFVSGGTPYYRSTQTTPTREGNELLMVPGGSSAITVFQPGQGGQASSVQLTKWSVEIKNQLDDAIQTTGLNREDILWLNTEYNITGTFKYINQAFWNQVQYGGGSQVPTGILTPGQFNFYTAGPSGTSLTMLAPYVEFDNLKVNRLDPDGKTMYVDFTAATRNIGSIALQTTVVSTTSGHYDNAAT